MLVGVAWGHRGARLFIGSRDVIAGRGLLSGGRAISGGPAISGCRAAPARTVVAFELWS